MVEVFVGGVYDKLHLLNSYIKANIFNYQLLFFATQISGRFLYL